MLGELAIYRARTPFCSSDGTLSLLWWIKENTVHKIMDHTSKMSMADRHALPHPISRAPRAQKVDAS